MRQSSFQRAVTTQRQHSKGIKRRLTSGSLSSGPRYRQVTGKRRIRSSTFNHSNNTFSLSSHSSMLLGDGEAEDAGSDDEDDDKKSAYFSASLSSTSATATADAGGGGKDREHFCWLDRYVDVSSCNRCNTNSVVLLASFCKGSSPADRCWKMLATQCTKLDIAKRQACL